MPTFPTVCSARPAASHRSIAMSVALVADNDVLRERWVGRLTTMEGITLSIVASPDAQKVSTDTLAIFVGDLPDAETFQHVRLNVIASVLVSDLDVIGREADAYQLGFDDCIDIDCDDAVLRFKLDRIAAIDVLNRRLTQAQKLESIGELAAGIAHEINTPIQYVGDNTKFVQEAFGEVSSVLSACQDLLASIDDGGDVAAASQTVKEKLAAADVDYLIDEVPTAITQTLDGVDRVAKIVRAMKEFSHPGVSEMTPTDVGKSIQNTVMVARNEWKYVAEMVLELADDMPLVPCLPGELNQVLLNMVVNAAHAIGESLGDRTGDKGTITIGTSVAGDRAEIRISDTGRGIARDDCERIFHPFYTTKVAGKGTGQGLAIAQSVIVEKHGGSIDVQSELGVGTTFVIRIPMELSSPQIPTASDEEDFV